MTSSGDLDALAPLEPERSARQIAWLLRRSEGCTVLDAGCGGGRVTAPLAEAGVKVISLDCDPVQIECCAASAPGATCMLGDLRNPDLPEGSVDLVCCLGNTFCLLHDVDEAIETLTAWHDLLRPGGAVLIDDIPHDCWEELTEGNWCAGIADDGRQLVWAQDDAVFALRSKADHERPVPDPGDRRMRLWTTGALRLLARASGLGPPVHHAKGAMIEFSDPAS